MTGLPLTDAERALLLCLLAFYREHGPGAAPAIKGLDEEAGIDRFDIADAVKSLRAKELVEYWELQPAVRLTPAGLAAALALDGDGGR